MVFVPYAALSIAAFSKISPTDEIADKVADSGIFYKCSVLINTWRLENHKKQGEIRKAL
jgi:hypothetical protein